MKRFLAITILLSCAASVHAQEQYFAMFMDGQKIGHAVHDRTVRQDKIITTDIVELTLARAGISMSMTQKQTSYETPDGKPLGFDYSSDLGLVRQTFKAEIGNGKLVIRSGQGPSQQTETLEWPKGALLAEGLRLLHKQTGLKQGSVINAVTFDPETRTAITAKIKIGHKEKTDLLGRVVMLTRIDSEMQAPGGAFSVTDYVDDDSISQKTVMPVMGMNIQLISCDKSIALSKDSIVDFIDKAAIKSPIPLAEAENAKSIKYKIIPIAAAQLKFPSTDNQNAKIGPDGTVTLFVRPEKIENGGKFPYKGNDKTALEALKPSRYVQSDAKEIIALSKTAVADAKNSAEAARNIENFVKQYISNKDLSVGYASAVEVAQSKEGDCTEHAVLTAALCKAAGIPAQVVFGILYVDRFEDMTDIFLGHAWTQAYINGKWVQLDGTGHKIGPTRIAMAVGNGDPDQFFTIISTLGNFKIASATLEK